MHSEIRHITDFAEALELAPAIDAYAAQTMAEFLDGPLPEGVTRRFLQTHFDAPETLLLVLESSRGRADLGVCLTGPCEDPLLGTSAPMVLLLFVSPSVRHKGHARTLIDAATEKLAARGRHKLSARTAHNDDALISMGERWGFVREWEIMVRE